VSSNRVDEDSERPNEKPDADVVDLVKVSLSQSSGPDLSMDKDESELEEID
jgi:hypothetical protein